MKILMFGWEFPPFSSGGLGTACYGLTKGLSKTGDVDIALVLPMKYDLHVDFLKIISGTVKKQYVVNSLLTPYLSPNSYSSKLYSIYDAKENIPSLYGADLFKEVLRYAKIGKEIAECEDFEVIHAHDWLTFKAGIAAKEASGKPLIVHVHATEFDRTGGNGTNQQVYDLEREGMYKADMIIAVSNFTKNKIVEHYGVAPEKIRVVHNAVEFENYTLEKAHVLKQHKKIVLFLGRLTLQKGPDYFIHVARRVLKHYKDVVFVVAGSGDMEKYIIEKTAELGIGENVLFAGFLRGEDVHKAYQMADVYIMPSVSEPFGITPLESISNGTPVLISRQSGVSEVLTHCLKTDFWDVDEMANKIISVLRHPELHQCLTENSFKEVKGMSWDGSAQKCVSVYKEVIKTK